jgi:hypothetical protein
VDGSSETAKFTFTAAGQPKTKQTAYTVRRPTSSLEVDSMGVPGIKPGTGDMFELVPPAGKNGGINFVGNVALPADLNGGTPGQWMFLQMGIVNRARWLRPNNTLQVLDMNEEWALDGRINYSPAPGVEGVPNTETGENGNSTYWNTGAQSHPTQDTPATEIVALPGDPQPAKVQVGDFYRMYVMFLPPGQNSVWVPLNGIDWYWGGTAVSYNPVAGAPNIWAGQAVQGTPYAYWTYPNDGSEVYEAPTWDKNLDDKKWING